MGELLIKPYEISVWEDKLTQNGFIENKLAVIGSNTMDGPNKVYDPVFIKRVNGEKTLTFSLKYKYFDPYTGNEEVVNPFAALLANERKVKLKYDDEWYEFIIKDHTESSDELTWTYTCTDAFVLELSKNGYNITFDAELNNNQGAASELAEETLKNTDWRLGESNAGKQLIAEPIYKARLESDTVEIINASGDSTTAPQAGADIYVFYSYIKNKNGKFVQFIIRDNNREYTIDDKNVITDTNFRITTELSYDEKSQNDEIIKGFWLGSTLIISLEEVETKYQANRLVYNQLTTYDPVTGHTVSILKANDREIYKYTDYTYTTSNVVMNYITNGDNFNLLEDGSLQGWNPYVDFTRASEDDKIDKLELVTYPELGTGKELADISKLSQIEGFLKAQFKGPLTVDYKNAIYNSGVENQASFIESISLGQKFVFRWRAGVGELGSLQPDQNLRLLVAKYTRDDPTRYGYYYRYIDADNIILQFNGTPEILNNIIKGGSLVQDSETGNYNYVIDNVIQTPSTKYIYVNSDDNQEYVWTGENGQFELKTNNNYLPYYYLTAEAQKAVSSGELKDPTEKIGIFIYSIDDTISNHPIYIQDIQFTRFVPDSDGETPILIGNIPTATSNTTDYYYLKPAKDATAEEIQTYTSVSALAEALDVTENDIVPVYNEDSTKILSISASQSNCFNILQTIAETFECWVDLIVNHDDQGYITYSDGKPDKFVYLREFIGKDNWAGFKYGINLQSVERTVNSDEIVTKLIVDQSQSDYVDEGFVSIANAPSNQSGESYIINFDYYYNQGLLDRDVAEADKLNFITAAAEKNNELRQKEKQRRDLEASLTALNSNRTVFTELVSSAQDAQSEALADFEQLTGQTYEDYKEEHLTLEEEDQLTEEETIVDVLGKLYISSATINNYSGLLTNINQEYWNIREQLRGSENYKVKFWSTLDANEQNHIIVELNDYLPGLQFQLGQTYIDEFTISKKYFDILSDENSISFMPITGFNFEPAQSSYSITTSPQTVQILNTENKVGIEDEIEQLLEEKEELTTEFNNKYRRFIQEGTWNSTEYIDSELYYLDAVQVSNTSAQPTVSYTIGVVEVSELEGLEWYLFDVGDKTYIEDTEFFGWSNQNGVLTPAREEVIVSEVEWHLEQPDQNVITIQNYKTRFEDLFQRISAAVQTVQYNEATYAKISSLLDADGTINQDVLLESLNRISGQTYNLTSDGSVLINGDQILVQNLTNPANRVIITSEGIRISSDGGQTWRTAIDGQGINIGTVYTGTLNTQNVVIGSSDNPSFRWDKSGISAYRSNSDTGIYDLQTYVRYDEYGLYGIKEGGSFKAQSLQDVKDKAHFAVTWDGFFIKNSYDGGGQVSITSDNDFQVLQSGGAEKIKIGALEWEDENGDITTNPSEGVGAPILYGIRINDDDGNWVLKTGDNGNLELKGTIYANAGEIGGMSVNNNWMRMKYIVFEPEVGIYSTYPNIKGQTPVDPTVTVSPFSISDTDGSATFNNVTVRGSIKTSVFEYEEIQAVGGAFLFRPSSAIREVIRSGNDLIFTTEKPGLFKVGSWLKISNFSSADEQDEVTPDELNGFGLTYIYPVGSINGRQVRLTGAAEIITDGVTNLEELCGGSLIDMGNQAGTSNYGIGINSSDGFINLPPRAISLFETVIHPNQDPRVSYRYRGILGTLPDERVNNLNVRSSIYPYMRGTQGIYTDNMYIGDRDQYIVFYTDTDDLDDNNNPKKKLKISAREMVFEYDPDTGEEITWEDKINDATQGLDGEDAITVNIDSSAGNVFLNKNISTTLTCTVIKGNGTDITNQVTHFTWIKKNADGTIDTSWNRALAGNTITLTEADVTSKAIFICEVEF